MKIEYNEKEIAAMAEFHKGNRAEGLRLQIEAPKEVLRKEFQKQIYKECYFPDNMRIEEIYLKAFPSGQIRDIKGYKEVIQ